MDADLEYLARVGGKGEEKRQASRPWEKSGQEAREAAYSLGKLRFQFPDAPVLPVDLLVLPDYIQRQFFYLL